MKAIINGKTIELGSSGGSGDTIPIGTLHHFLGTAAPDGYLACDGVEYNIADYPALADFIEAQFGSKNKFGGDGETTFSVPDLQGRFLLGSSVTHELLENGGEETHTLTIYEMPKHHHTENWFDSSGVKRLSPYSGSYTSTTKASNVTTNNGGSTVVTTEDAGSSEPHNNMPPYFSVLICIKAK